MRCPQRVLIPSPLHASRRTVAAALNNRLESTAVVRAGRSPPCYPRAGTRGACRDAVSLGQSFDENPPRRVAEGDDTHGVGLMTGRVRLPGGEQRKASQKRARPAAPTAAVATPILRPGDRVRWSRYTGTVQRLMLHLHIPGACIPTAIVYR
jgi:hypothetical protein